MTRDQREAKIRAVIKASNQDIVGVEQMISIIADAWEDDIDEAFTRGIHTEQERNGAQG